MSKIKKTVGAMLAVWGLVRWLPDLLESVQATAKYGAWAYRHLRAPQSGLLTAVILLVGIGLISSEIIQAHLKLPLSKRGTLSDRDPRVTVTYRADTGGLGGNERFILTNAGGVDAKDVQIHDLILTNYFLRFACVPLLGSQGAEVELRPEIIERESNRVMQFRTGAILEQDWLNFEMKQLAIGKAMYEGKISYKDHAETKFRTDFTLSYTLGAQTAQTEDFGFYRE